MSHSHRIGDPARNQLSFDLDGRWLARQSDKYAREAERGLRGERIGYGVFFWLREQSAPEAESVWGRLVDGEGLS